MLTEFDRILESYCGSVGEEDNFIEDIPINSIDFIDMIIDIEKAFKITINEAALRKVNTVGDLRKFVEKAIEKKKNQE